MLLKRILCLFICATILIGHVPPAMATIKTKIVHDVPIFRPRATEYIIQRSGDAEVTIKMSEALNADASIRFVSSELKEFAMAAGTTTQTFTVPAGVTEMSVTFGTFTRKERSVGGSTYKQQYNLRVGDKKLVMLNEWYNYDTTASAAGFLNSTPMTICTNEVGEKRIQLFNAVGLEWRESMGGDLDQIPDWEGAHNGQGCVDTTVLTPGFYKLVIKNVTSGQKRSKLVRLTKGTKVSVSALPDFNLAGAQMTGIIQYVNSITSLTIKPDDIAGSPQDPITCSLYNVGGGVSTENEQKIKAAMLETLLAQPVSVTVSGNQCTVKKQGLNVNMQVQKSIITANSGNAVLMFDTKSNQTADITFKLSETVGTSGTGSTQTFNKNAINKFTVIIQNKITGETTTASTETVKLPAGDYIASFMADGYLNIMKDLKLTGGSRTININMVRISQYRKINLNAFVSTNPDDPVTVNHISIEAEVYADDTTKVRFPLTGAGVLAPYAPDENGNQRWHAEAEVPTGKSVKIILTAECTARAVTFTYKASMRIKVQPEDSTEPSQVYEYSAGAAAGTWNTTPGGLPTFTLPMRLEGETVNLIVKRKDAANNNVFEDAEVTNVSVGLNVKNNDQGYTDFKITEPKPAAIWMPHKQFFKVHVTVPGAIDINKYRSQFDYNAVSTGYLGFYQSDHSVITKSVKTPITYDPGKYNRPAIFFTYEKSRVHNGNIVANIKITTAENETGLPPFWAITSGRILVKEIPMKANPAVKVWSDTIQLTGSAQGIGEFVIGVPNKSSRYEFSGYIKVAQKQITNGREMFVKGSGRKIELTTELITVEPLSGFGYYSKNVTVNLQEIPTIGPNETPTGSYYPPLSRIPIDCTRLHGEGPEGSMSIVSRQPFELGGLKTELVTAQYACPFVEGSLHTTLTRLIRAPDEPNRPVNYYAFNADAFAKLKGINEAYLSSWTLDRPLSPKVRRCEVGKALGEENIDALICWRDVTTPSDPNRPDRREEWWFPTPIPGITEPIISTKSIYETGSSLTANKMIGNLIYVMNDFDKSVNETTSKLKQFNKYRDVSPNIITKTPFKASDEHIVKITLRSEDNTAFPLSQREYDLSTGKPGTYTPSEYEEMSSSWTNTIVVLKTNKQEKSYKWIEKSLSNVYQRKWLIKGDLPIQMTVTAPDGQVLAARTISQTDQMMQTVDINTKNINQAGGRPMLILQADTDHPNGFAGKKVYAAIDPTQFPTMRTHTSGTTADAYAFWGGRVVELPVDEENNKKTKQIQVRAAPAEVKENKVKVIFYTGDSDSLMSKTWLAPLLQERTAAVAATFDEMFMEKFVDTILVKAVENQGTDSSIFIWRQKDVNITSNIHSVKGTIPYLGKNQANNIEIVNKCFDIYAMSDQGFRANLIDVAVVLSWIKAADLGLKALATFRRVGKNAGDLLDAAKTAPNTYKYRNADFTLSKNGNDVLIENTKTLEKWRNLHTFEEARQLNIKAAAAFEQLLSKRKMIALITQQPFTFWLKYLKPIMLTVAPFGGLPPSGMPIITVKSPEESRFIVPNCGGCSETMQITQWITNHFNKPLDATPINICIKARNNRSIQIKAIAAGHEPYMQIMRVSDDMNNQIHIPLRRNTLWGLSSIENFFQAHPMMQEQVESIFLAPEMYAASSERGGLLNYIASGLIDFNAAVASDFKIKPGVVAPPGGGGW